MCMSTKSNSNGWLLGKNKQELIIKICDNVDNFVKHHDKIFSMY